VISGNMDLAMQGSWRCRSTFVLLCIIALTRELILDTWSVTIRYDTIGEFNVEWKAEYSALSSTRSQKKKLKQPTPVPL